jgi:hypothetical protein
MGDTIKGIAMQGAAANIKKRDLANGPKNGLNMVALNPSATR